MPPGVPLLDTAYLTVWSPATRGWTFLGLEAVVLVAGALTLAHAARAARRGDWEALFAWTSIVVYGVCLEILSYNAFPNFTHGQFTVMLYHRKLPLYVTALYPVLLYTARATVRRLGLSARAEPLAVGLAIVAMDFPFDVLGPDAGWWAWDMLDPNVHYRWHGVPVTSYYWHLTWGAILCALCRWVGQRHAPAPGATTLARASRLALAVPVMVATLALGRAAFLPFDLLGLLRLPDGANGVLVLAAFALSLAILLAAPRAGAPRARDPLLVAIAALFYGFHLAVALALHARSDAPGAGAKLAVLALATAFGATLQAAAQRGRERAAAVVTT
jgi:hypothetical protein